MTVRAPEVSAHRAAGQAKVTVTELRDMADMHAIAELFVGRWNTPAPHSPLSPNLLRAFAWTGNYVAGAFSGGRLAGASAGFLRQADPHPCLFSHTTSVLPGTEGRGVGYALKQHQRAWALARGITTIEWTFDPLVRRNAYFNLVKLGAVGAEYLVNFYGAMHDSANGDQESDRVLIRWRLRSRRAVDAASGLHMLPDLARLRAAGVPVLLSVGPGARPVRGDDDGGDLALCQVPEDIVRLRAHDEPAAVAWLQAIRGALTRAFASGLVAQAMTPSGWYVLARPQP